MRKVSFMVQNWCVLGGLLLASAAQAGQVGFEGEGHAYHPIFSVDGKYVAFEVNRYAGDIDLFIAPVTGELAKTSAKVALPGGSNPFGGSGQVVVNPTWHKDGLAVFEGSNQGGQFRIYYRPATGGSAAEMISSKEIPGDLTFPAISADGRSMAFVADETGNGDLRIRDSQTGKVSRVTNSEAAEMYPSFSGDGGRVLFTRRQDGGEDVFELDVSTGVEKRLVGGSGDQTRPAYAGDAVVFFDGSRGEGHWDLIAWRAGSQKTIARDVALPLRARPAVSPDGAWVAFSYSDPVRANQIMLARADGSATVAVPTGFTACQEPALAKQGDRVVLAFTALPASGSDWRFLHLTDVTDKLK